jgi:hypothetical protein
MWILTGLLLGSLITSTHDTQEACEGRKALLSREKNTINLECRHATSTATGSKLIMGCTAIYADGKCAN